MAIEELEREQEELLPDDDLTPYRGKWVALRHGRVVASDIDPVALRANPDVEPDDLLTAVPDAGEGIYVL